MSDNTYPDPDDFQDPLENYEPKSYDDPLEKALAEESADSIRHEPMATIAPDVSIKDAVQQLVELEHACLLVQQGGKLMGVFSHRDVLDRAALEYDEIKDHPVSEVMTNDPVYVTDTDSAAAALSVMAIAGYRHVPVVDSKDELVGIISPQRVAGFLEKHLATEG